MVATLSSCGDKTDETLDKDTYNISILFPGYALEQSYEYQKQVQDAINEKLYNDLGFKVNVVCNSYVDQYETMLALDLANKMSYDFIRTTNGTAAGYAEKDIFVDIKPLIDQYAPDLWDLIPENAWAECTINGKVYGIPTCSFPISYGLWIRGDWLKKLNKELPTSLAELEALCEAIKTNKEINPNGKVIPMAGNRDIMEFVFLGMFTDHPGDYVDENGNVQPKYLDPGYRKFVEKLAEWYKKGYIDDLVTNGDENTINSLISKDMVGIHVANVYQLEYSTLNSYNAQKNLDMKWIIPFKADTKKYYSSGFGSDIISFPVTGKNTEKAFQYMNWYYNNQENSDLVLYGLEGVTYERSQDPETGKEKLSVPADKLSDTVKTFNDLKGFHGANVFTRLQLLYTYNSRPAESAKAYDSCNTDEILNNCHLDVTRYFQTTLPVDIATKSADSRNVLYSRTLDMITGKVASTDAEWDKLRKEWENLGGKQVYEHYTKLYNENKATLSFLSK